jgi:hypothetical protein
MRDMLSRTIEDIERDPHSESTRKDALAVDQLYLAFMGSAEKRKLAVTFFAWCVAQGWSVSQTRGVREGVDCAYNLFRVRYGEFAARLDRGLLEAAVCAWPPKRGRRRRGEPSAFVAVSKAAASCGLNFDSETIAHYYDAAEVNRRARS